MKEFFKKLKKKLTEKPENASPAMRLFRKIAGFAVLFIGIVMMIAPGPAFVVIPLGLLILSTEYEWAHRLLEKFKKGGKKLGEKFGKKKQKSSSTKPANKK